MAMRSLKKTRTIPIPALGKVLILLAIVVLFFAAMAVLARKDRAAIAYYHYDQSGEAQRLDPNQSYYVKALADGLFRRAKPSKQAAADEYRRALLLAPCSVVHWRDWGDVNQYLGEIATARKAYEVAEYLAPNDYLVQQEFGNLFLARGLAQEAAPHHCRAIKINPSLATTIYPVYWSLGWTPLKVEQELLTDNSILLCRYWQDCLAWLDAKRATELWNEMRQTRGDVFDAASYRRFFDFLIARKEYDVARKLWDLIIAKFYRLRPEDCRELFWNGHFEKPIAFEGGMEWNIAKTFPEGARATLTSVLDYTMDHCLKLHFDGKANVSFAHVSHFFFIESGRTYRLKYRVRAKEITTDNGPYVKITVFGDSPRVTKGKIAQGTGTWMMEDVFSAPESARWAGLTICRDRSAKLNNRIQGDAWFDSFVLEPVGSIPGGREEAR